MKNIKKYFIFSIVSTFLLPLNSIGDPNKEPVATLISELTINGLSELNANLKDFNQNIKTQLPKLIEFTNNFESRWFIGTLGLIGVTISLGLAACCTKSIFDNYNNNGGDKNNNNTVLSIGTAASVIIALLSLGIIINRNKIVKYFSGN